MRTTFSTENTELLAPQVSADYSRSASHRDTSTSASTSFIEEQSSPSVSESLLTNEDATIFERRSSRRTDNSSTSSPSGIHPHGTCSCDSHLITDEPNARVSISRIVMLAEALFEVLHRQPVSLSLSMASKPAPESVVDSFPLRSHKKMDEAEDVEAVEQVCPLCRGDVRGESSVPNS